MEANEQRSTTETVSEETRRSIFRELVTAQDEGASVADSRVQIASQFDIPVDDVLNIEREGIANQWDPL